MDAEVIYTAVMQMKEAVAIAIKMGDIRQDAVCEDTRSAALLIIA